MKKFIVITLVCALAIPLAGCISTAHSVRSFQSNETEVREISTEARIYMTRTEHEVRDLFKERERHIRDKDGLIIQFKREPSVPTKYDVKIEKVKIEKDTKLESSSSSSKTDSGESKGSRREKP